MTVTFKCEIDARIPDCENVKYTKILKSTNPEKLLESLAFTNGTANVPTIENLLYRLFVGGCAYAASNFIITIE